MGTKTRAARAPKKNSAARSRAPAPEELDDLDDDDLPDVDDAAEASAADLDAVFAELGGNSNATITVTRVGQNGREERCDRFMASELVGNFEMIRDRWGAGTYWLYGHDGKTLARKRPITFARSVDELQRAGVGGSIAVETRSVAPSDLFTAAIDRLATLQREQFQQMLTLMNGRQGAGLAEVMTLAEKMASLSSSRGGGSEVETLLRGFDLARKFGAGGEEVSIGGALAEFVRAIRDQPPLLQAPGAPAATSATGGDHMQAMIQRALAQQLPALLRGAQSETDPGVYAQLILDQVPEIYLRPVIEYLKKPDWFDLLARADGRVVPSKLWFEALGSEIVRATSSEVPPAS